MENIEKWKVMSSKELIEIREKYIAYIDILCGMIELKSKEESKEE